MDKLPTLYKKTSTGALQQWTIGTEGNTVYTWYGQTDGAMQEATDVIREGKNIGRRNETTPEQQAVAQAKSKWTKQLKKAYVRTSEAAMAGESSDLIEGGELPMLAHKYRDHAKKIVFPAFAQPKLDGHRCTTDPGNGETISIEVDAYGVVTLWARSRAKITSVPHINMAVAELKLGKIKCDGELYNHDYHDNFEQITHLLKRDEPCLGGTECEHAKKYGVVCPGYRAVQLHIYDAIIPETGFGARWAIIKPAIDEYIEAHLPVGGYPCPLVAVETIEVANHEELMEATERFMEQGYEGGMVRNAAAFYQHRKCYDLQKIKVYEDDEFPVIGVEECSGPMAGMATFVCRILDDYPDPRANPGGVFTAKKTGKLKELRKYWDDPSLAIGRIVTVQFQGFTKKNRVPRFPVVLRFRKDL